LDLSSLSSLPIVAVLSELRAALAEASNVVLEAPPGAGKSTGVPLALLDAPWLARRRIVMLQPRRLAARAVARRLARLAGDPEPGGLVGYRTRLDTRVGPATRIEAPGCSAWVAETTTIVAGVSLMVAPAPGARARVRGAGAGSA